MTNFHVAVELARPALSHAFCAAPQMVGIDCDGFDVRAGERLLLAAQPELHVHVGQRVQHLDLALGCILERDADALGADVEQFARDADLDRDRVR